MRFLFLIRKYINYIGVQFFLYYNIVNIIVERAK